MFAPYCPGHRSRVLIALDGIDELVRIPEGFDIHFRCHCGHEGWHRSKTPGSGRRSSERSTR